MNGEVSRRPVSVPASYKATKEQRVIVNETRTTQTAIQAIEHVTEAGMYSALRIKQLQQQLELIAPGSSEALNLIATTGCMTVLQAVQQFGQDVA